MDHEKLDEKIKHYFNETAMFYGDPFYPKVQKYLMDSLDETSKITLLHYYNNPVDSWVIGQICIEALEASNFNGNYENIEADKDLLNSFIRKFYGNCEAIKPYYEMAPSKFLKKPD